MQTCLSEGRWEEEWIDQKIHNSVSRSLGELLRVNIGVDQAKREIKARAKGLQPFAKKYMSDRPKVGSFIPLFTCRLSLQLLRRTRQL